jgi:hypothetical protein
MIITTAHIVLGACIGTTFLGMFGLGGYYLYLGCRHMGILLSSSRHCLLVNRYKFHLQSGPWGKMALAGVVGSGLLLAPYLTRHGLMDKEDVANFPEPLKSRLLVSQCVGWFLMLTLLLEVVAVKATHYQS